MRGDNNYYSIFIPGVYLDGNPVCKNAKFVIAGFVGNGAYAFVEDVSELSFISKRENGIEMTFKIKNDKQINYGFAIPTQEIIIETS